MAPQPPENEFDKARRAKLLGKTSDATTPLDALGLARDWIAEHGPDHMMIIIEKPEGGVVTFSADLTIAQAVFLLESAKWDFMRPEK